MVPPKISGRGKNDVTHSMTSICCHFLASFCKTYNSIVFSNAGREISALSNIKGPVYCFSMPVVMKKCLLLNLENNLAQIRLVVFEKNAKNAQLRRTSIPKNDVTEPKARLL